MQKADVESHETVAVMFSGGRDSTLAAAYYAERGCAVHLLTFENGSHQAIEIVRSRVKELRSRWPEEVRIWNILSCSKALRDIALMTLTADVRLYGEQLVCLGSAFAMVARSIDYCVSRSVPTLAVGYAAYQRHYPEQSPAAIQFFAAFAKEYHVDFRCPGQSRETEEEAKVMLDALGLSPKALEATGMWDWTYPENVGQEIIEQYLTAKSDIARRFIASLQSFRSACDQLTMRSSEGTNT